MIFVQKDEVILLHDQLIERFGGLPGLRDEGLLDSALLAAANRFHYEQADVAICAATYAYHLTRNHPFMDGNKRIGAATAELFVQLNGGQLTATDDELVELILAIAAGQRDRTSVEADFARWVVAAPR